MFRSAKKHNQVARFKTIRILVVTALCRESGSHLRARYLAHALEQAGAQVRFIPGMKALPLGLHYFFSLILNFRLLFVPCNVIIGLKPLPNITLVMLLKQYLGTLAVLDIDDIDFGYRTGWLSTLNRALQRPFPARFSLVTYHSDHLRAFITETFSVGEEQLFQLPQGVDVELFTFRHFGTQGSMFTAPRELEGKKVVAYTGHLNIASDIEAIFEIIKLTREHLPDVHLLVVGGGPREHHFHRSASVAGVADIVCFTGYVPPEEVVAYLRLADVGIVYYNDTEVNRYRESMKLREMLALGLKIVSNDVGDLKRFAAFTYQTRSSYEAVAQELVRLLEDGGDGREGRGAQYVREHLDWKGIGASLFHKLTLMINPG